MKAKDEIARLVEKLADGSLPPDEPLFVLRAQDVLAADIVRSWAAEAWHGGTPEKKCEEAEALADLMDAWPVHQIPGRPDTRETA